MEEILTLKNRNREVTCPWHVINFLFFSPLKKKRETK
jgi:hypothetical protein